MATMDIGIPRFYPDLINFLMTTGTAQNGNFDVMSGSDLISTYVKGSEAELFDLRPINTVTFNTTASASVQADHVLVRINKQTASWQTDYIAILNHNMSTAKAKIRVNSSDTASDVQVADMGGNAITNVTEIVNADTISNNVIIPDDDGSTIFTFDATDDLYYGIQFEGTDNQGSTTANNGDFDGSENLRIGCIMFGEHYTMPHAPDVTLKRTIVFDGVNVQESLGGQKFGNATHLGRRYKNTKNKSPFLLATAPSEVYGGRINYDLNFSYLQSNKIMPSFYHAENEASETVVSDLWNRTKGNLFPFIFHVDSSETGLKAEQYLTFSRFAQDGLVTNQVSNGIWNINLKIEEEF